MNRTCLLGRITKKPEVRYTENNIAVCQFSLAVTRNFKNANGEYDVDFINCVIYRKTAELMNEYVEKGDKLAIEGRLQVNNYQDKEGNKRQAVVVVVEHLSFVEGKKETKKEEPKIEEPKEEKKGLLDDVFAEFGEQIQMDETDLAF